MRQITIESRNALMRGENFKKSNMQVHDNKMYLHGNKIAWIDINHRLWISNCGWFSNTTKERLNALPKVHIVQKNYSWFLNGTYWNGQPVCVGKVI